MQSSTAHQTGSRLRILLVEDHAATGQTLLKLLRSRGHDATLATNGGEALMIATQRTFDLLLSDLGLPDLHGWALLQEMRKIQPNLRAIAVSGFAQPADLDRSASAGFDLHIAKPARMTEVDQAILYLFPDSAVTKDIPGLDSSRLI